MKKCVAIIGAGMMTRPMVEYLHDTCGYEVIVANRTLSKAEALVEGRSQAQAVAWSAEHPEVLMDIMERADLAISMVPKPVHIHVARACLARKKHMLTTSYEIPELLALDQQARETGILILNELGEVPGMDHFGAQLVLDEIAAEQGRVLSLKTYGSGLPAYEFNRNPFGYKFSWDPRTMFVAAQTPGAYLVNGEKISVAGDQLFGHFEMVDIPGLGTFESYPNKDVEKYVKPYGLDGDVTFYRGLLRFPGYCNKMRRIMDLGLMDGEKEYNFHAMTYADFTASLIGVHETENLDTALARRLGVDRRDDVIYALRWLGLFEKEPLAVKQGSRADVLLERMLRKMSYNPGERDMIILHVDALAQFPGGRKERRTATMRVEGIPGGHSAMSRAVALPAAIAARLVLEGEITEVGCHMPPTLPTLYEASLKELAKYGYGFKTSQETLSNEPMGTVV